MTFKNLIKRARESFQPPDTPTSLYPSVLTAPVLPDGPELWFTEDGWLQSDDTHSVELIPLEVLFWKGMHRVITEEYQDQFVGVITHYDALGDGRNTAKRLQRHDRNKAAGNKYRSVSTHFLVCRDGHIIQLVSIRDRTWHAARKGLSFSIPPTRNRPRRKSSNPNHWFVGLDLCNWGKLTGTKSTGFKTWTKCPFTGPLFIDPRGRGWEAYTSPQLEAYIALQRALVAELDIPKNCQLGHEHIDPTNKIDPGPALHFYDTIDTIYAPEPEPTYLADRMGEELNV